MSKIQVSAKMKINHGSSQALLAHIFNLQEALRILFEKFASNHSVVIYGEPSAELLENAKTRGIDITIFSFLQGL
jgi:hypothetical protein